MDTKQQTPFEKKVVEIATVLHKTDAVAQKMNTTGKRTPYDEATLKKCMEKLNKFTAERQMEKEYTLLKNFIEQKERTAEAIGEVLETKGTDLQEQYALLDKLKEKVGADPSNRDLIKHIEQLQNSVVPGKDKTGEIAALQTELENVMQQRREEAKKANETKKLINFLMVMVYYEQRFGLCALANPNIMLWTQFVQQLDMPVPEGEKTDFFSALGKQHLTPVAQKLYTDLQSVAEEEEPPRDFSKKEERQAAKRDGIAKLKKIAVLGKAYHEAIREDTEPYKKLMEAQNALTGEDAENMSLKEMQGKLQIAQKAAKDYMKEQVYKGQVFGKPRQEARLVYAAALHDFARKFSLQISEMMKQRDIEAMNLSADVTREYVKNSLKAMDLMIKEQVGIDLAKGKTAPEKKRRRIPCPAE